MPSPGGNRVEVASSCTKVQRFLRILAKSRNGTEGTEILGIPVPVTGILRCLSTSPTTRPTRGMARMRRGSEASDGAPLQLCTHRTPGCARLERRALSWTSSGGGYDGSLSGLSCDRNLGRPDRNGTDRNGSERIGSDRKRNLADRHSPGKRGRKEGVKG